MNHEQYNNLRRIATPKKLITEDTLTDKNDRTLLLGQMKDRTELHVYLKDNQIHTLLYKINWVHNKPTPVILGNRLVMHNYQYIPDSVYPERSDYEFCKRLIEQGYDISFRNCTDYDFYLKGPANLFNDSHYYGYTL